MLLTIHPHPPCPTAASSSSTTGRHSSNRHSHNRYRPHCHRPQREHNKQHRQRRQLMRRCNCSHLMYPQSLAERHRTAFWHREQRQQLEPLPMPLSRMAMLQNCCCWRMESVRLLGQRDMHNITQRMQRQQRPRRQRRLAASALAAVAVQLCSTQRR